MNSLLHLFYPPLCTHCDEPLTDTKKTFCCACVALLEQIDARYRCSICFSELEESAGTKCRDCRKGSSPLKSTAAVFDYHGPAATLVKKIKYGGDCHFAEGAAAFIATQFVDLGWPMPDLLIPVPSTRLKCFFKGFNHSSLLAEKLSVFLSCPVGDVLIREEGQFSQAGLTLEQRLLLPKETFRFRNDHKLIKNKKLLIIDDVMTTGTTLRRCGEILQTARPSEIRALTFCKTAF